MPQTLPPLRPVLDVFPSPDPQQPGLLLRDPMRYSDAILVLPPLWAFALRFLDGRHTALDVQDELTRAAGELVTSSDIGEFVGILQTQGFLVTEEFERMRDRRHAQFRAMPEREPAHAGTAYPQAPGDLRGAFDGYFEAAAAPDGFSPSALGIAAPHVSPEGGYESYAAAYRPLAAHPELRERTFVVLGTSHYGQPERFGITRKPFVTPYGRVTVDAALAAWLLQRAPGAITDEDYCHAVEHSIEFQCVFLQHALGPDVKILPILCGQFAASLASGQPPESDEAVARFFEALGELAERERGRLFWVLGVDMAHVGRRYGDALAAVVGEEPMARVAQDDQRRLESVCAGDAAAFFEQVKPNGDDLKWCGYSPLYTFLKAVPAARGRLLRYQQWNIDPNSVVSFAGLEFFEKPS